MQKGKLISLIILGLFLTTFLVGVVSAVDSLQELGKNTFIQGVSEFISGALPGQTYDTVAKLLLIALVAMIVYSIVGFLPFIPKTSEYKDYIQWGISITVAILSFIYVPLSQIRAIVANYEALGVALTSFLPLLILVIFTEKLEEASEGESLKRQAWIKIINKGIWSVFVVYLIFKWFSSPVLGWLYLLAIIITAIWVWKGRDLIVGRWLLGEVVSKADANAIRLEIGRIEAKIQDLRDKKALLPSMKSLSSAEKDAAAKSYDGEIATLRKDLNNQVKISIP